MLTQEQDQQLVERVQRGDRRAFDLLVMKYQHKILGLIVRFVHDTHEAQDVAQEAFIKAYRALGNFRGESAFYTWLYRIAINTAKNHLVARGRRPPDSDVTAEDAEFCDGDHALKDIESPERAMLRDEIEETVHRTIQQLPEDLRTALVYEVRVRVQDEADTLRLGMPATVTIDRAQPEPDPQSQVAGQAASAAASKAP